MMNYNATSGDGSIEAIGMAREAAFARAAEIAERTGEAATVWTGEPDTDGYEEWTVDAPEISLKFGPGRPSEHYPADEQERNGATDYDVGVTVGTRVIEGEITLYRDVVNGGLAPCGAPPDGWVSGSIHEWLRTLDGRTRKAVIGSLACRSNGPVTR